MGDLVLLFGGGPPLLPPSPTISCFGVGSDGLVVDVGVARVVVVVVVVVLVVLIVVVLGVLVLGSGVVEV